MTKEKLIKELELLADSCDSNYALEINGYNRGVLDALSVVNKYFALAHVSSMLKCESCGITVGSRNALDCYNRCHICTKAF
jgi:succinate dehydrogenase/fumarate reductase-like Fe-S protein